MIQIPSDREENESDEQRLNELLPVEKSAVWKFELRKGL